MTRSSLPWARVPLLAALKERLVVELGITITYAFVNLYVDGNDYIGWHSDKEKDMVPGAPVVSVSLGAPRPFQMKRYENGKRVGDLYEIDLKSGSVITMEEDTQALFQHCVPKRPNLTEERWNITFRHIKN
jgi:alpha-ketoglutarate-dependent dioxygenase alkB family protein 2